MGDYMIESRVNQESMMNMLTSVQDRMSSELERHEDEKYDVTADSNISQQLFCR